MLVLLAKVIEEFYLKSMWFLNPCLDEYSLPHRLHTYSWSRDASFPKIKIQHHIIMRCHQYIWIWAPNDRTSQECNSMFVRLIHPHVNHLRSQKRIPASKIIKSWWESYCQPCIYSYTDKPLMSVMRLHTMVEQCMVFQFRSWVSWVTAAITCRVLNLIMKYQAMWPHLLRALKAKSQTRCYVLYFIGSMPR